MTIISTYRKGKNASEIQSLKIYLTSIMIRKDISKKDLFYLHGIYSIQSYLLVGHLFWFIILAQHETDEVILYIHSVHKHRGNSFKLQNYKTRYINLLITYFNIELKRIKLTSYTNTKLTDMSDRYRLRDNSPDTYQDCYHPSTNIDPRAKALWPISVSRDDNSPDMEKGIH
jgi:hypothetical protein